MVLTDPITNFFVKGYVSGTIKNDLSFFDKYNFVDCNCTEEFKLEKECLRDLNLLHYFFSSNLVSQIFINSTIKNNGMWNGVDEGSSKWHNDFEDGDPFNSNILLYLDDNLTYGNNLQVTNGDEIFIIYPKPNEFIWLNQSKAFKHRALHKSGKRRLLSFEFYIDNLK